MVGPGTAHVKIVVLTTPRGPSYTPPENSRHTRWIVQAASFQDRARAEALADDLSESFSDVKVRHQGEYYRVQIGPWKKRKKADKTVQKLQRRGHEAIVKAVS